MSFVLIDDAKVRRVSAFSKDLGENFPELLRQAWCFATDQEMKGCECRKLKELAVFFYFFWKNACCFLKNP